MQQKYGFVLGCPLFALGAEVCTQEPTLQRKIQEILAYKLRYLETAIRDALAAGLIEVADPLSKARMIQVYYEGLLTLRLGFKTTLRYCARPFQAHLPFWELSVPRLQRLKKILDRSLTKQTTST